MNPSYPINKYSEIEEKHVHGVPTEDWVVETVDTEESMKIFEKDENVSNYITKFK